MPVSIWSIIDTIDKEKLQEPLLYFFLSMPYIIAELKAHHVSIRIDQSVHTVTDERFNASTGDFH